MLSLCYKKWRLNSSFFSDAGILETKEVGEFDSSFPFSFKFNAIPAPYPTQDMLNLYLNVARLAISFTSNRSKKLVHM